MAEAELPLGGTSGTHGLPAGQSRGPVRGSGTRGDARGLCGFHAGPGPLPPAEPTHGRDWRHRGRSGSHSGGDEGAPRAGGGSEPPGTGRRPPPSQATEDTTPAGPGRSRGVYCFQQGRLWDIPTRRSTPHRHPPRGSAPLSLLPPLWGQPPHSTGQGTSPGGPGPRGEGAALWPRHAAAPGLGLLGGFGALPGQSRPPAGLTDHR